MKEITIQVKGMVCHGCENRVQNALKNKEGVEQVVANHEQGTVTILAKKEIEKKELEQTIEDIGFEVVKED